MLQRSRRAIGPVWRTPMGESGMISLLGPDALEFVLQESRRRVLECARLGVLHRPGFPGAIMAMDGDEHRYQRRIMQVAFRKPALRTYLEQMGPAIDLGLGAWMPARDSFEPQRDVPASEAAHPGSCGFGVHGSRISAAAPRS